MRIGILETFGKNSAINDVGMLVQVVAGTNYKLFLDVANSANKMEHVEATVYGAPNHAVHIPCCPTFQTLSMQSPLTGLLCVAAPLGNQEMQLTGHRTPKPDEVN